MEDLLSLMHLARDSCIQGPVALIACSHVSSLESHAFHIIHISPNSYQEFNKK